jgi:hypothetical protein
VEREVILKIMKLREGQNIAIYPFSRDFGDLFTAVGYPCPGKGPNLPVELKESFNAVFLSYSGTVLMIRTDDGKCLLIEAEFIRDIEAIH